MGSLTLLLLTSVALVLAGYATVVALRRLRAGKPKARTFGAWLRDLWDAASGVG
jgi:hypothetical protein